MQEMESNTSPDGSPARYADYESFVDAAMRTDIPDYAPVVARMTPQLLGDVMVLMSDAIQVSRQFDQIKKHLYYGKSLILTNTITSADINIPKLTEKQMRLLHAAIGIQTESGEILQQVYDHIFLGKQLDDVNFLEEFGDVSWYQRIGLRTLGFRLLDMLNRNVAKLRKRFPEKFTEQAAIERDLKAERAELEAL